MFRYLVKVHTLLPVLLISFSAHAADKDWTERLSPKADLRLRYESIESEGFPDRDRWRYRVRLGLTAELYDDVRLIFSLATGADDPVSANVTFGDSFGPDDFGIDLAYVDWQISDTWRAFGGKMKNPIFRAGSVGLIYDSDLNPEGLAVVFDSDRWFATMAAFFVEESAVFDDSHLYHVQGGFHFEPGGLGKLRVGAGYFGYTNTIGKLPFFFALPRGNTVDDNDRYVFDYRNSELFAEFKTTVGDWPVMVYGQFTRNHEVSGQDTGYAIGAKLGQLKGRGSMEFAGTWEDVEADSVIGAFNDSDFGGGGTDASGLILEANYMLRDRIELAATLFLNKVDGFQRTERDYKRLQLDVQFNFN